MAQKSGIDFSINENVNEYIFARVVEDHNIHVRDTGYGSYITAREGRALHDQWLQEIQSRPLMKKRDASGEKVPVLDEHGNEVAMNMANIPPYAVRETLMKVMGPRLADDSPWKNNASATEAYNGYRAEWDVVTGISIMSAAGQKDRLANGVKFKDGVNAIPCSPFDEKFSMRQTMLEHGTEIMYAKPEDLLVQVQRPDGKYGFQVANTSLAQEHKKDIQFQQIKFELSKDDTQAAIAMGRSTQDMRSTSWHFQPSGPMASIADVSGVTRLREFMSNKEFQVASRWMESVPESQRMTPQMTDHSVAILEMFRDNGIPYSIKPDQRPGQLKAVIGNTKMSVRLTDTTGPEGNNGLYIGRVYNDGNSVYMSPQSDAMKQKYRPTIEDTKNVVLYGMGRSVDRATQARALQGPVGAPSEYKIKGNSQNAASARRSTYLSPAKNGKLRLTAMYGTTPNPDMPMKNGRPNNVYLFMQTGNNHSKAHMDFPTQDSAEGFLREAVDTARANFEKKVNIDYLVQEHQEHPEEDYVPILSGDPSISPIQLTYWNVLRGRQELFQPEGGVNRDHSFDGLMEALNMGGDDAEQDLGATEDAVMGVGTEYDAAQNADRYVGTPEENIRAHLRDNVDLMFGQFEPDANGMRFSPALVASFMESAYGMARNKDNLVAAMRTLEFSGDELRGNDFETGTIKDKMLRFNPETARPMEELAKDSVYMQSMLDTIVDTLRQTACEIDPKDVMIDDMGVVRYEAKVLYGQNANSFRMIQGEIGQIFEPDHDGVVETRYNGSQNKLFTPGYDCYIVPETEETKGAPLETRYRFRGLPQILHENIEQQLRYDVQNIEETVSSSTPADIVFHTGTTTSLNNTYRGLYHTGYKVSIEPLKDEAGKTTETLKETYVRQMHMTHMPDEVLSAVFATARGMVHFDKDIIEGSSVNAEYRHELREARSSGVSVHELANDNVQDPYELTNHANMAITAENSDKLFDPVLTGSGKNQGAIRYFVLGAGVNADGTPYFTKLEGNQRAPIMMTKDQEFASYIPADRQQMEASNYMTASGVAGSRTELDADGNPSKGVGVAQLTLQGLTFDDGAVISKSFAERYGVIGDKGEVRPLMPGDKICDMSGNKSIVSRVIDPEMDLGEAKKKGLDLAVQLFRDNPNLDVVQAPYSAVSRFNAAGAKHAMQNPEPLKLPDGSVHEGCIGFMPMTITHHTAEDHTKGYDDDDVKQGKGRKVSTQQSWMLCAKGATHLMKEIFEPNNNATINMREYLNTLGYDMSETGKMRFGYQPHNGEERYMFRMPDDNTLNAVSEKDIGELFTDTVGTRGGFMELPFPLDMPSGQQTQKMDPEQSSRPGQDMYAFPVMSAHLRSGQTFEDGTRSVHDYTNQYQTIYKSAVSYLKIQQEMQDAPDEAKGRMEASLQSLQRAAQQAYDGIADDVMARKFESKHNIARDELMARRMPNSATAVWTPNPNLGVNQIAMPQSLADTLAVKEGGRIMVNRDPLLRAYGMRDMEVVIDNDLHGVAVHPAIAVSFDGDFDGDSVGLWAPKTEAAKREAYELFSFEQNMLDFSKVRPNGDYALMFNDSMDIISAEAVDQEKHDAKVAALKEQYGDDEAGLKAAVDALPETLRDRRMRLEHAFNEVYRDESLSKDERMAKNEALTQELSSYARDVMVPQVATELISYASPGAHMESLSQMVDHGAKGSHKKLGAYAKYAGFEAEKDENGRIVVSTVRDVGHTLATAKDVRDTELSTAIKSHGTGNAGAVSQRVVAVTRDRGLAEDTKSIPGQKPVPQNALESALRLTYLATQGILQAKHDPVQAQMLYAMVNSDIRSLWKGYSMERTDDKNGMPRWKVRYENGEPVRATPDEWVKTFMDMHTAKNGLDLGSAINVEDVKQVAAVLTDTDGRMMNVESDEIIQKYASSVDRLAYRQGNARDILKQMATEGLSLFDGSYTQYFAPEQIRKNIQAEAEGRLEDLKPLQPADTRVVHNTISQKASAIELDVRTVSDPIRAKDAMASQTAGFDPATQAAVAGRKPMGFDYSAAPAAQEAPEQPAVSQEHRSRPLPNGGEEMLVQSERERDKPDLEGPGT